MLEKAKKDSIQGFQVCSEFGCLRLPASVIFGKSEKILHEHYGPS